MDRKQLRQLHLDIIVDRCRQESARFRAGQPGEEGYCFELLRRAVEEGDQDSWSAIHSQYYLLVAKWIGGHQDSDELIELAFERLWRTLRDVDRWHHFGHIGAVLAYLRKCAVSVRLDLEREERRRDREVALSNSVSRGPSRVDDLVLGQIDRDALGTRVRHWLDGNLQDDGERLVVQLSYELDLSPDEMACRYPEHFADVEEVRRIKERVLKRLRRRVDELKDVLEP